MLFHTILFDLRVALVFALMLVVLVFAHEFGHYIFARLFGMGVEEFAIGMGVPRVATYFRKRYRTQLTPEQAEAWNRGEYDIPLPDGIPKALAPDPIEAELVNGPDGPYLEEATRFTIRAWPIGGFVRIRGATPDEHGKEVQIPGGFYSKRPWQRLVVLFAGPVFSVLAGIVILLPYLMIVGKPAPQPQAVIGAVGMDGRGAAAGLKEGDRVVSIDGVPVKRFYDIVVAVRTHAEQPLHFLVDRGGESVSLTLTPVRDKEPTQVLSPDLKLTDETRIQGKAAIGPLEKSVPMSLGAATVESFVLPFDAVASLAKKILHPAQLKEDVGGPITIVRSAAAATKEGVNSVIVMAATLSISLGIFNLLPFFPLDGGQMILSFGELLRRGRRSSMRVQNAFATVGITALVMLIVGVFIIDFQRLHSSSPTKVAATPKK